MHLQDEHKISIEELYQRLETNPTTVSYDQAAEDMNLYKDMKIYTITQRVFMKMLVFESMFMLSYIFGDNESLHYRK